MTEPSSATTDPAMVTCHGSVLPVSPADMRATAERILDTAAAMPTGAEGPYRRAAQHLVSAAALIDAISPIQEGRQS